MYAVESRDALQRWRRVEEEEKKPDTLLACRVQMRMQWRSACLLIWREAAGAEAVRDFPPRYNMSTTRLFPVDPETVWKLLNSTLFTIHQSRQYHQQIFISTPDVCKCICLHAILFINFVYTTPLVTSIPPNYANKRAR